MTFSVGAKILGIAIAVGLDVLSLSIAVGVMRIRWAARVRLGLAFSAAEVLMQVAATASAPAQGASSEPLRFTLALQFRRIPLGGTLYIFSL
jgi:hypothetical protein